MAATRDSGDLKHLLQAPTPVYGVFCSTPAALVVELLACAGFDFVVLDLEHTLTSGPQLEVLLLAARAAGLATLVRVPPAAPEWVVKALDAGADGIVFPRVQTPHQAQAAARLCRYAPAGERGLNAHRHVSFGTEPLAPALERVNRQVLVVAMIEDREGVANAGEIAATAGVDVLLEGAADLSQSLGVPWETRHRRVRQDLQTIARAAAGAGKLFCALPRVTEDHRAWVAQGVHMFIVGDDRGLMRSGFTAHLAQFKRCHRQPEQQP